MPENSLDFAKILNSKKLKGTFYFRSKPYSWKIKIVKEIYNLGHEIGYHYENLSDFKGDFSKAISDFENNLKKLRQIVPISTICMHGSPLSKHDNRDLWKEFNYKDFELIAEPYFDVDFNSVLYLTDTGRNWNTSKGNIRDTVKTKNNINFNSTDEIISAFNHDILPNQIMINFHPQRWSNNKLLWIQEFVGQGIKNQVKKIIRTRNI
jgi:hypothetical protein